MPVQGYIAQYIDGMGKKLDKVDELKERGFHHIMWDSVGPQPFQFSNPPSCAIAGEDRQLWNSPCLTVSWLLI